MTIAAKLSPEPVWQLLDLNGTVTAALNTNGSTPSTVGPPGTAYGVSGFLSKVKVLISAAQLKALKATPLSLIPAPGVVAGGGRIIGVANVAFRYLFGTTAYTLNAGTIKLFYGPVANAKPLTASVAAGLVDQVVNSTIVSQPLVAAGVLTDAQAFNVDIELGNDGAAELTLGDGTLEVVIGYKIMALP